LASSLVLLLIILIAISLIVNTILSGKRSEMKSYNRLKAIYAAESGFEIIKSALLHGDSLTKFNLLKGVEGHLETHVDYTSQLCQSLGYITAFSSGNANGQKVKLISLWGIKDAFWPGNAIVLTGKSANLVLTGCSKVIGDISLPNGIVRLNNDHSGDSCNGPSLEGQKKELDTTASFSFPVKDAVDLCNQYYRYFTGQIRPDKLVQASYVAISPSDDIFNSKYEKIYIEGSMEFFIHSPIIQALSIVMVERDLDIRGSTGINGGIFIVGRNVTISENANIQNVFIFSRGNILIKDDVHFQGQILTQGSVKIKDRSVVEYPSSILSVFKRLSLKDERRIELMDSVRYSGSIASISTNAQNDSIPPLLFKMAPGCQLTGTLFSNANVMLNGSIVGLVVANGLTGEHDNKRYYDWLENTTVDRKSLPNQFVFPHLFSGSFRMQEICRNKLWQK